MVIHPIGFYGYSGLLVFHFKRIKGARGHVPGLGIGPSLHWLTLVYIRLPPDVDLSQGAGPNSTSRVVFQLHCCVGAVFEIF